MIHIQRLVAKSPLVGVLNKFSTGFTLADTSSINKCYELGGIMIDQDNTYGDDQKGKEENKIIIVSININGLRKEIWKEKNNVLHNFLHQMQSDIITL